MHSPIIIADQTERAICAAICRGDGIKAREIAKELDLDRTTVNHADIKTSSLRGVVRMKSKKKEAVFYVWAHTHKTTS